MSDLEITAINNASIIERITQAFATTLPFAMKPMARHAAIAAIKATRPADAVRAARAVVQRVPAPAKVTIKQAILARNAIRDERASVRSQIQDRYTEPFHRRVARLREQHDREHYEWVWRWIAAGCEEELAAEKATAGQERRNT